MSVVFSLSPISFALMDAVAIQERRDLGLSAERRVSCSSLMQWSFLSLLADRIGFFFLINEKSLP